MIIGFLFLFFGYSSSSSYFSYTQYRFIRNASKILGNFNKKRNGVKLDQFLQTDTDSTTYSDFCQYSHLFNKHGGWNKRGGAAKVAKSLKVEAGINVEGGIFWKKLVHKSNKHGV